MIINKEIVKACNAVLTEEEMNLLMKIVAPTSTDGRIQQYSFTKEQSRHISDMWQEWSHRNDRD